MAHPTFFIKLFHMRGDSSVSHIRIAGGKVYSIEHIICFVRHFNLRINIFLCLLARAIRGGIEIVSVH